MRLVSLHPAATDALRALGLGDALVAHTHRCEGAGLTVTHPRPSQTPALSAYEVDWPTVASLMPDVIVTRATPGRALKQGPLVTLDVGLPARGLALEARTLDEVFEGLSALGIELGVAHISEALLASLRGRIDAVAARNAGIRHRPVPVALEQFDPPLIAGGWVPEMIALAGGTPVLSEAGERATAVTWEEIANVQPELFLTLPPDADVLESLRQLDALGARNDLRWMWKAIPAAYFDQIYALEARHSFTGPGPGLVDGIETLAGLLHPDRHPAPLAALALRP